MHAATLPRSDFPPPRAPVPLLPGSIIDSYSNLWYNMSRFGCAIGNPDIANREPRKIDYPTPPTQEKNTRSGGKMWRVFHTAIGVGMVVAIVFYITVILGRPELLRRPAIGVLLAAMVGILIGLGYFLFFKLLLRSLTVPFLRRAQSLTSRSVTGLPSFWKSNEVDKLEELLNEALATLERLNLFSSIAHEVVATLDLQRTLGRIVGTAVETLPATSGLILLRDEERRGYAVRIHYVLPLTDREVELLDFSTHDPVPGWVALDGPPLIISDAQNDERVHPILRQRGVRSLLSAPLNVGRQPLGALVLLNSEQNAAFDEQDVHLVSIYTGLASVAINNAHLFQAAEEERTKLFALLNDTTDAVIVVDRNDQVLLLNPSAEERLKVKARQIINQPVSSLQLDDLGAALETVKEHQVPLVCEIAAPGERTLYASVSPVHEVGWVIVMQDISSLKQLDRLRTEWVAAVSHDLKNPITAIQLSTMLLEKAGPLNDRQQDIMLELRRGSDRLRALVTDILDLARLEAGPAPRLSNVNPITVVKEAVNEVESLIAQKRQNLVTDLPAEMPLIRGDGALLTRALVNLLGNAAKYTPIGGRITIRAQLQDEMLHIKVIDTGPGIPEADLPHIFDRFYRVQHNQEQTEGTGLGLSIVKSIVEKHGGQVWVESKQGAGSTFTVIVPCGGKPPAEASYKHQQGRL